MTISTPTWLLRADGGYDLLAPCHLAPDKPIPNVTCVLGSVAPEGRDWRWERRALAKTWWPFPDWKCAEKVEGTASTVGQAMELVEEGLTRGRAERPAVARVG